MKCALIVKTAAMGDVNVMLHKPRWIDGIGRIFLPELIRVADTCDLIITHGAGPRRLHTGASA